MDCCNNNWPALMTRKTAAKYLDYSEKQVQVFTEVGQIPVVYPMAGGRPRYRKSDLDKFVDSLGD